MSESDSWSIMSRCDGERCSGAEVFKLHYTELLTKDEEVERLKTVIEGLTTDRSSSAAQ